MAEARHAVARRWRGGAGGALWGAWAGNCVYTRCWSVQRHGLSALQQGVRYRAVGLVALGMNLIVIELLVRAGMPAVPAQAVAIAAVMPVNFLLNRRWSFR